MTRQELAYALASISAAVDDEGHGLRVTLKNGEAWSGDYFLPDKKMPGLLRVHPYLTRTVEPQPAVFIDIEQIASVQLIKF